jgi:hypothetical protein
MPSLAKKQFMGWIHRLHILDSYSRNATALLELTIRIEEKDVCGPL